MYGENKKIKNQVALIFDNIFFSNFSTSIFSKSNITFQYDHLGSFTLLFVCGERMGWYFQNICKHTVKPATVVTSIRKPSA